MIKKILSLILAAVLVFSMIPFPGASAANADPAALPEGVVRIFGADRYATSFKAADTLKAALGISKFQSIVVASGTGFPDALAGSYLAAVKSAPILLVRGANVDDVKNYIKSNLVSGGTVYLLGGTNAVPKAMEDGLNGFKVKRLGGADRYDTNLLILKEAGVGSKDIIVCTGLNFADSLSASAAGLPILLVKDGLYTSQKEFLSGTSGRKIIIGGSAAVNATVETQLKAYGSVKRLAGSNRYETSVLVAKEFFSKPTSAVIAYAHNFPDGLCAGPLAYSRKAPLILTDNNKPTAAIDYANGLGIRSGYVLGGTALISDSTAGKIFASKAQEISTEPLILWADAQWHPAVQTSNTQNYNSYVVTPRILRAPSQAIITAVEKQASHAQKNAADQISRVSETDAGSNSSYVYFTIESVFALGDILSVQMGAISYQVGDARPWHGDGSYTLNISTGSHADVPTKLPQLLSGSGSYPQLERAWNEVINKYSTLNPGLNKNTLLKRAMSGENGYWSFTPDGLKLGFDQYEVAPGFAGAQSTVVPYSRLTGELAPQYLPSSNAGSNTSASVQALFANDSRITSGKYDILGSKAQRALLFSGSASQVYIYATEKGYPEQDESVLFYATELSECIIWLPPCESSQYRICWTNGNQHFTTIVTYDCGTQ